jgi:hydrogenase/urease accessory protein HupE
VLLGLALGLGATLLAAETSAHPLAPALLELIETAPGVGEVRWKTARLRPRGMDIAPELPAACRAVTEPSMVEDATSITLIWGIDCAGESLVGSEIGIRGIESAKIDVLVRLALADGRVVNEILRARRPAFVVPARPSKLDVLESYLRLGVEHILTGLDHLAFVLGLLILVVQARPLIKTISAFTLGHSITLSLVALGIATVPSALVELLIALSVLALAVEIATPQATRPGLLRRRPWVMAAGFGLLHGMGFAGALAEVGLPDVEIPLALFCFNLGIEIGQLAFVFVVIGVRALLHAQLAQAPDWVARVPAYGIGSLATFWCLERASSLL